MDKKRLREVVLIVLEAGDDALHPRWPKGTPGGRGGEFRPTGKVRDLKRGADLAAANLDYIRSTGGSAAEVQKATEDAIAAKKKYDERASQVSAQTRANRERRGARLSVMAAAKVEAERERVQGLSGDERKKGEGRLKDLEDIARISAQNTANDPNIQRQIGRAITKGEVRSALKNIAGYAVGGAIAEIARRAVMRAMGEEPAKGASVVRALLGAGKRAGTAAGTALQTPAGRVVGAGLAILGATAVIREFMPGAKRQRNHALLVKYDRNSRIEWQKHQNIFGKNGDSISPGQPVLVGHTRRPATYLGAEWRPHGANPTTTGRLIVQQGKKMRAVSYGAIKGPGKGDSLSPQDAMKRASEASGGTWKPPSITGQRAFIKHGIKKLEPRLKHEATAEIRGLRRGASTGEKAIAYGLERAKSQAFSKELRRQRRRHPRPNSRRRYAALRIAAGRARPGDRELVRGMT